MHVNVVTCDVFARYFSVAFPWLSRVGERQSIAQKGVRAIDVRSSQPEMAQMLQKPSVRAPGLSVDEREHPFV